MVWTNRLPASLEPTHVLDPRESVALLKHALPSECALRKPGTLGSVHADLFAMPARPIYAVVDADRPLA